MFEVYGGVGWRESNVGPSRYLRVNVCACLDKHSYDQHVVQYCGRV